MKSLKLAVLLASSVIIPNGFANGNLVPIGVNFSYSGVEFPRIYGNLYIKNTGDQAVKYVGPIDCYENPFDGGGEYCRHTVTHRIGNLWAWNWDTSSILNFNIKPREVKALPFYTEVTFVPFSHCQLVTVELDYDKKFNQTLSRANYQDDIQQIYVRNIYKKDQEPCPD